MKRKIAISMLALLTLFMAGCASKSAAHSNSNASKASVAKSSTANSSSSDSSSTVSSSSADSSLTSSSSSASSSAKSSTTRNLTGKYYSADGNAAQVTQHSDNDWQIDYSIPGGGQVTAAFKTDWHADKGTWNSTGKMIKSDGDSGFTITTAYKGSKEIKITMSDNNPDHTMIFTTQKPVGGNVANARYDVVLKGDLTPFAMTYSNDSTEEGIIDSGMTLRGFEPEDFYHNETNVFPAISNTSDGWHFWSGSVHAEYLLDSKTPVKKVGGYYEATFIGQNGNAIVGRHINISLIPPHVTGPDGSVSATPRMVFFDEMYRPYRDGWWHAYGK